MRIIICGLNGAGNGTAEVATNVEIILKRIAC